MKRYERQTVGKVTVNKSMRIAAKQSTKQSTRPSAKPSMKRIKKKAKKKGKVKRSRLPISKAEIRRLGLECDNFTEADSEIRRQKTKGGGKKRRLRRSLQEYLKRYAPLKMAWKRGRFLRNLRDLARTGASVSEAAKKLGFANGRILQAMLDDDVEVGDLWDQTQLGITLEIKQAIIEAAKEGKADAVRAVESFLLDEKERLGSDLSHITILQLTELTGRARQTIHEWYTKFGLPRNADKTFDLSIFLAWFEEFLLKKVAVGKESAVVLDPLKAMKAEKLKVELARHRNEILDRNEVMISLVAWAQHIVSFCDRGNVELSRLCVGQPREKIIEIHKRFFQDLHAETARIPKELHLPDDKEKELVAFLQKLKPRGNKDV